MLFAVLKVFVKKPLAETCFYQDGINQSKLQKLANRVLERKPLWTVVVRFLLDAISDDQAIVLKHLE